ncbi:fungal-specific transcription factor domain-containing protein [Phlebopus sp. FC_14]|nr:fungal-specific transcription factor domain-containing protein [Phlebopus sp. FC_14]
MHPFHSDHDSASSSRVPSKRARNTLESQDHQHRSSNNNNESSRKAHHKKQPLSCAECRRLKLKCDRVFPCQSCSKRGCAEICPDGALTSGKGSRFILANTEQLHAKIIQMSDRIRQLEDALASSHPKGSSSSSSSAAGEQHPLLHQDLLRIKNSLELYSPQTAAAAAASSCPSSSGDQNLQHVASASRLPDADRHPPSRLSEDTSSSTDIVPTDTVPRLSPEIEKLSQSFPYLLLPDNPMRERIYEMLPPREEAEYLCTQARLNALWQYNLDPSETWLPNLVHHVYTTPLADLSFRRLSLLFIMMAIGLLVDLSQPRESPRAEIYHRLARASLCEMNLMDEPSLDLIQTLFYMVWYLLIFSDKSQAVAYAWSTMGLTVKLAQSLGLHRDCNRWKVIPEESQRRRMLFWELLNLDARLALSLGRPPSICLDHVDCRQPSYSVPGMYIVPGVQTYHEWKHLFFVNCLTPVLTAAISAHPQPYEKILAVDSAIRNFPVPPTLDIFHSPSSCSSSSSSPTPIQTRQLTMQQVLVSSGREIVLLQLHRNFLTSALSSYDAFSYTHTYAPSAVATFLSARRLIATLRVMEAREPQLSKRFMCFWFNAFSGAVALSLMVSRAPFLSVAPCAVGELEGVLGLFERVARECGKVRVALPLLTKITERAKRSYLVWKKAAQECASASAPHSVSRSTSNANSGLGAGTSAMDVDVDETQPQSQSRQNRRSTPPPPPPSFTNAHPDLVRCLQDVHREGRVLGDGYGHEHEHGEGHGKHHGHGHEHQGNEHERPHAHAHTHADANDPPLSTDILALALGQNGAAYLRAGVAGGGGGGGGVEGQRGVGNGGTFNFDFGALASNVESASNTYMSWF